MTPNAQQLAAVGSDAEFTVVIAGPGSGKSFTLVERVKYLVHFKHIPADRIVVLTFTNAAAHVFSQRLRSITNTGITVGFAGTLHGYMMRLLQKHGSVIGYRNGSITIVTQQAQLAMLLAIRKRLGTKISDKAVTEKHHTSNLIWKEYAFALKRANMLDYDSLLSEGFRLLTHASVFGALEMSALLGDEMQDSGAADWAIFHALPAEFKFAVADPDQSVYAFRGGKPEHIVQLAKTVETHTLDLNYRSDVAICEAATKLIRHNTLRLDKAVVPVSTAPGIVEQRSYRDAVAEWFGALDLLNGRDMDECAVLCRTNLLAKAFRVAFRANGIPLKNDSNIELPEDWSFALTCLSFLIDPANDYHVLALLKHRGDSDLHINGVRLHALQNHSSVAKAAGIRVETPETVPDALQGLVLLGVSSESMHLIRQRAGLLPNEPTLADLLTDLWNHEKWQQRDDAPGVTVGTVHSAKGSEFDFVFVAGCEEGILPSRQSMQMVPPEVAALGIEEERRLMFVAITRARRHLVLSRAEQRTAYGKTTDQQPSRFLSEIYE